jgi:hypothetical protein
MVDFVCWAYLIAFMSLMRLEPGALVLAVAFGGFRVHG